MLKAIAIDDEPIALEVIKTLSAKVPFIQLIGCFTNPFEAMNFLGTNRTDLLFLDIKMPDISGIDFLKSLPNPPMVIFTTAYSEHAVQGFELDVIDYLLKPFSQGRFLKACNKALEQFKLRATNNAPEPLLSVFIKSGYQQIRIELMNILYAESSGNYVQIVLVDRKIVSRLTMSEVQELLPAHDFIRIHRSYIVAKKRISKIEKRSIWINQAELPVGSGYIHEIEKLLKS